MKKNCKLMKLATKTDKTMENGVFWAHKMPLMIERSSEGLSREQISGRDMLLNE
jgi:hypothetical protein